MSIFIALILWRCVFLPRLQTPEGKEVSSENQKRNDVPLNDELECEALEELSEMHQVPSNFYLYNVYDWFHYMLTPLFENDFSQQMS